jgi:hypothetical protein
MILSGWRNTNTNFMRQCRSTDKSQQTEIHLMKTRFPKPITLAAFALAITTTTSAPAAPPSFSLAWSEYPSWSVFGEAPETDAL